MAIAPVTKSVTVDAPVERAFDVFTAMTPWWPMDTHHIAEVDATEVVIEPRAGGRWFERGVDGSECQWGRVLAYERPKRLVLAWHLNADWQFVADEDSSSELEITFSEVEPGRTRVDLEHRNIERHGARVEEIRASIDSEGGWNGLLRRFKESAETAA